MKFVVGIGMDSCVTPLRHGGLSLVQTTDFFYPLVDDPYMMVINPCNSKSIQGSHWSIKMFSKNISKIGKD